ncbi:hypothetical protein B6D52_03035, partial [Candidatus Parcubacteria bacterium 4484_255]
MISIKTQFKLIPFFLIIAFILTSCVKLATPVHSPLENNQDYVEPEAKNQEMEVVKPLIKYKKLPIAIIIDNLSSSWPLFGLNKALVVYEAPVEADITRLLAIFSQDSLPQKIGPVRSARPYFADWAAEYKG